MLDHDWIIYHQDTHLALICVELVELAARSILDLKESAILISFFWVSVTIVITAISHQRPGGRLYLSSRRNPFCVIARRMLLQRCKRRLR